MSAIDEYVNNPIRGERATAEELHPGTLVRYNDGSTELDRRIWEECVKWRRL